MNSAAGKNWSVADSAALYGINQWGNGNFSVSADGAVTVTVTFADRQVAVPLPEIVQGARDRGHALPLLLRIENLLDARISLLNETFRKVIRESGYRGSYNGVFPVKVNQQCAVIEEICRFGAVYGHGLEAGSKAELLLCLANLNENGLLICNGYKDREFIDLGLWANKLGYRCFFVIESQAELPLIIERSRELGIKPLIGLRIKVSAKVGGLWTETSGDRSSFGLSTAQLMATIDRLREEKMLDCLQLLHCHLGSQIPDIEEIRAGVREACRFYCDLATDEAVPLRYLDLGGGLAVDYIGNQSTHSHSRNYDLSGYCRCLVETIRDTLAPQGIEHPTIITESGRATVAHTSILLFDILDVMRYEALELPGELPQDIHPLIRRQQQIHSEAESIDLAAGYVEAVENRDRIRDLFRQGEIRLRDRAMAENLFLDIARRLSRRLDSMEDIPVSLSGLKPSLADIYYGNLSVFQSLPDTWAIGQVFPIMPIERLTEYPERNGSISDLTCDCDGKLDRFILSGGESPTLPLHPLDDRDYILGVFLMGAYQETLGDLHNLFGDTNVISVRINENGGYDVVKEQSGDTISEILAMLEYNPAFFFDSFRARIEDAVRKGHINIAERQRILNDFSARLNDLTYFKTSN